MPSKKTENTIPASGDRNSLNAKLLAYCTMAGGALAVAAPAQADVVYSGLKNIPLNSTSSFVPLDLDDNMAVDFNFKYRHSIRGWSGSSHRLSATYPSGNAILGSFYGNNARNLALNAAISSALAFWRNSAVMAYFSSSRSRSSFWTTQTFSYTNTHWHTFTNKHTHTNFSSYPVQHKHAHTNTYSTTFTYTTTWKPKTSHTYTTTHSTTQTRTYSTRRAYYSHTYTTTNSFSSGAFKGKKGYLGVRFAIGSEIHYGWVQFEAFSAASGTIIDWAYETNQNTSIRAGDIGVSSTTTTADSTTTTADSTTTIADSTTTTAVSSTTTAPDSSTTTVAPASSTTTIADSTTTTAVSSTTTAPDSSTTTVAPASSTTTIADSTTTTAVSSTTTAADSSTTTVALSSTTTAIADSTTTTAGPASSTTTSADASTTTVAPSSSTTTTADATTTTVAQTSTSTAIAASTTTSAAPASTTTTVPAEPCTAAFHPARISKAFRTLSPLAAFVIRGDANAAFSRQTHIDWGTDTIKTVVQVPLGKRTLLAVVLVGGMRQKVGDVYQVTVGDCTGELPVKLF